MLLQTRSADPLWRHVYTLLYTDLAGSRLRETAEV
jgi:hypothetical protein